MCHCMQCFAPFSDDIKQDAATTAAGSKLIVELLQNRKLIFADTIWENTDVCAEK